MFKKTNFKLIKLKDVHSINQRDKIILGNLFKSFKYNANKIIYEWLLVFLRFLKILPKFEIYFLSNKKEFEKMKIIFLKEILAVSKKL